MSSVRKNAKNYKKQKFLEKTNAKKPEKWHNTGEKIETKIN